MRKLLRSEFGALELVCIVLDEHAHLQEHGTWPPGHRDCRPSEWRGYPDNRAKRIEIMRRKTFWSWSARLRKQCRRCDDCNRPIGKFGGIAPMLHDEVWVKIAGKLEVLCDRCCRRRLGRPITIRDLRACMFNVNNWRWLDGSPWAQRPAVDFHEMPDVFFGLPIDQMVKLKKIMQGVAIVFDMPVEVAQAVCDIRKRETFEDMQLIFMGDSFKEAF